MQKKLFIGFLFLILLSTAYVEIQAKPLDLTERFQILKENPVLIVFGLKASESDKKVSNELHRFLLGIGINSRVVSDSQASHLNLEEYNVILVGGPIANRLTREFQTCFSSWFGYYDGELALITRGNVYYGDELGIIDLTSNPLSNGELIIVLLAGKTRNGTEAAVKAFMYSNLNKQVALVSMEDEEGKIYWCSNSLSKEVRERIQKKTCLPVQSDIVMVVVGNIGQGTPIGLDKN